jgi:hypothetical protein
MSSELGTFTVNLKNLNQDIKDPVVTGAGDANGRTLRVVFSQEAATRFAPEMKVYLKWYHQERKVQGYNVFKQVCQRPQTWEINYPRAMLREGNVMCCIELVDDVSIAPTQNFHVHVLSDVHDGHNFVVSDDYSVFQQAVIDLNDAAKRVEEQMSAQKAEFDSWREDIDSIKDTADLAYQYAQKAVDIAENGSSDPKLYVY